MSLKSCPPCTGDCNQGRSCPARQPVARILLHPACASSPDAIEAVEKATGLVAVRDRRRPVVRLLPALRLVKGGSQAAKESA
jgi:hypothetical protein